MCSAATPPPELWDGFIGAVLGAVLGALVAGVATFLVVRWQTVRLLNDERDRAREARDEEHSLAREAREEERRDRLRLREEQALGNLLPALAELQVSVPLLYALPRVRRAGIDPTPTDDQARAQFAYETLLHGLRVDLPLVQEQGIRERYRALVDLVEELSGLGLGQTTAERERWRGDVLRYIGYVRHTIKSALHGESLPPPAQPPVLKRQDHALWTPPVIDPEDIYFMPPPP